ncbi:MAG: hypothetical protein J6K42_06970 [Clostridia bacterium]|nr:hypothetical protein [Clostridia bacterium]
MKKAIIIIVSVLVILAGVFSCLFFFTDTFNFLKPASNNFSKQAKILLGTDEEPKYSEYEEFLNKLKSNSSNSAELNMNMNLNLPSDVIDYSTQKLINSSNLKFKGSYDSNSKAMLNDVGLYKDDKEVLTLSLLTKDTAVSVGCKDLYDKYVTIDLSKYESFCKANNIEVDEETKKSIEALSKLKNVDTNKLAYDLFYISEEDFKSLNKNYSNILVDLIDKENYTTKKNQKVSVGDEDIKTTAYSLTMDGKDAIDFTNKLIDKIKNDSATKKLIIEKYNIIKEYNSTFANLASNDDSTTYSTNTTELPELTESTIDEFLSKLVEQLEDMKDSFEENDKSIRLTIYSNKKSQPVKFEISVLDDKDDDEGSVIFTEDVEDGKNTYTIDIENINKLSGKDSSESSSYRTSKNPLSNVTDSLSSVADSLSKIIIEDSYKKTDDSRKGTIKVSAKISSSKKDILEIQYDTVNSKSESKFNISVSSPLSSSISLDLVSEVSGLDTDTQKLNFSLSGKYSLYSAELSINGSTNTKAEVPELTDSNSVDLFTLSNEELYKLYTDIITKAADVLPEKLSSYGVDIKKEDILSSLPQIPQTSIDTSAIPTDGSTITPDVSASLTEE